MKYDKLIFVQAVADLRYALSIFEKKTKESICICIVNNLYNVYDFLKQLELPNNVKIVFFSQINLTRYSLFSCLIARKELEKQFNSYYARLELKEVYFFSRFYDWYTPGIIVRLLKKNIGIKVFYYDHYDDSSVKNDVLLRPYTLKQIKLSLIAKITTLVSSANHIARHQVRSLEFNYLDYPINKVSIGSDVKVDCSFHYKINSIEKNNMLFLLSPSELDMLTDYSIEKLKIFLESLRANGKKIILKGHPRLGNPISFESYFDDVIPLNVPLEFIDFKYFETIIGIISSSLNYGCNNNINTFSLINLLQFKDVEKKEFYRGFLKELSDSKIEFPSNMNFIK